MLIYPLKTMDRKAFESLVAQAVDDLPQEFQDNLENVNIVVQDWPTRRQLAGQRSRGRLGLLGLYEGVPQTARGQSYNLVLPDRITLFRKPIEATCRNREEVRQLVQDVLRHEIAHHFGTGEERLQEIERHRRNRNQSPKDG